MIQSLQQARDRSARQRMRNAMKQHARSTKAKGERARKRMRKKTWGF